MKLAKGATFFILLLLNLGVVISLILVSGVNL